MSMKIRRWIWMIAWILSLVGISFYGGAISYGFFFAMTLLPVVSLVYLLCVYFRFKIYQEVESRTMVCGQSMPYFFTLRNEDWFGFAGVNVRMFPDFSYVENVGEDAVYELLPGDTFTYHTSLTCKYRGEYEVGVKEVVVSDFFRIFRLRYPVPSTIKAIVRPRLVHVTELTAMPELTDVLLRDSLTGHDVPDVVVRNYVSGDDLKRIHWKVTARQQALMVRTDTGEEAQGITLLLDTMRYSRRQREYLPWESKMLEVFLALGMFFAGKEMHFRAYYQQGSIQRRDVVNLRGFEEFGNRVAAISFEDRKFADMLQDLCEENVLQESKAVIAVLHELDDRILFLTEELAEKGLMVLLYVVTDENMDIYLKESDIRRKIAVVPVEGQLEGVL